MSVQIAAFYRFVALPDYAELRAPMLAQCREGCLAIVLSPGPLLSLPRLLDCKQAPRALAWTKHSERRLRHRTI